MGRPQSPMKTSPAKAKTTTNGWESLWSAEFEVRSPSKGDKNVREG